MICWQSLEWLAQMEVRCLSTCDPSCGLRAQSHILEAPLQTEAAPALKSSEKSPAAGWRYEPTALPPAQVMILWTVWLLGHARV
jgi:hypothetical protein